MRKSILAASLAIGVLASCSAGPTGSSPPSGSTGYSGWPGSGVPVGDSEFVPVLVSSEVAVGNSRLLVTVLDGGGGTIAAPDLAVRLAIYDLAASTEDPVSEATGTFEWLIPESRGIYVTSVDFTHAGDWGLEVTGTTPGEPDRTGRMTFSVRATTQTPAIGAPAPPSDTPTADDPALLAAISTDQNPDPAFYTLSIREAIAAGKPFVVVFATPAFCTSGTCGPALDLVKPVAADYAGRVNFIHVEPYWLEPRDGGMQPKVDALGQPQTVPAVHDWGLPTEPYVFVVDARGKVSAKFEGEAYPEELRAALDAVLP